MTDQPVTPDREAKKLARELGKIAEALRSQADISDRTGQWSDLIGLSMRVTDLLPLLTDALDRARQQGRNEVLRDLRDVWSRGMQKLEDGLPVRTTTGEDEE